MSAIRLSETVYWWSPDRGEKNVPSHVVCDDCLYNEVQDAIREGLTVSIRGVVIIKGREGTYFLTETEGTATPCECPDYRSWWECPNREDEDGE